MTLRIYRRATETSSRDRAYHTLFDEVELCLKPHRTATSGRAFQAEYEWTALTHCKFATSFYARSPLKTDIVHCRTGKMDAVAANKPAIADSVEGKIRRLRDRHAEHSRRSTPESEREARNPDHQNQVGTVQAMVLPISCTAKRRLKHDVNVCGVGIGNDDPAGVSGRI